MCTQTDNGNANYKHSANNITILYYAHARVYKCVNKYLI